LSAIEASKQNFVVLYPNNDTGSDIILAAFKRIQDHPRFRAIPSMRFEYFLTLLKNAVAIIGNSSAGIREAPIYGVPVINIGTRQANRFNYAAILNVPEDKERILDALRHLPKSIPPSTHFGNGNSANLFFAHLQNSTVWTTARQKQFRDLQHSNGQIFSNHLYGIEGSPPGQPETLSGPALLLLK
jgi:UDP-N-acetylglucosamine 2-epimerase (hydrolysing)